MKYAGLLLGCLIFITASTLTAMSQSTRLTPAPLKITAPAINTRTTRTDRSGKAWLSQPLVQVENVSSKTIEYLTIEVRLPGVTDPFMLAFGQQPGDGLADGDHGAAV